MAQTNEDAKKAAEKALRKIVHIVGEIVSSEKVYMENLQLLMDAKPDAFSEIKDIKAREIMRAGIMSSLMQGRIFLEALKKNGAETVNVDNVDAVVQSLNSIYVKDTSHYFKALRRGIEGQGVFTEFMETITKAEVDKIDTITIGSVTSSMSAIMINPVQRGPRHVLFLTDMAKTLSEAGKDDLSSKINETNDNMKNFAKVANAEVEFKEASQKEKIGPEEEKSVVAKYQAMLSIVNNTNSSPELKNSALEVLVKYDQSILKIIGKAQKSQSDHIVVLMTSRANAQNDNPSMSMGIAYMPSITEASHQIDELMKKKSSGGIFKALTARLGDKGVVQLTKHYETLVNIFVKTDPKPDPIVYSIVKQQLMAMDGFIASYVTKIRNEQHADVGQPLLSLYRSVHRRFDSDLDAQRKSLESASPAKNTPFMFASAGTSEPAEKKTARADKGEVENKPAATEEKKVQASRRASWVFVPEDKGEPAPAPASVPIAPPAPVVEDKKVIKAKTEPAPEENKVKAETAAPVVEDKKVKAGTAAPVPEEKKVKADIQSPFVLMSPPEGNKVKNIAAKFSAMESNVSKVTAHADKINVPKGDGWYSRQVQERAANWKAIPEKNIEPRLQEKIEVPKADQQQGVSPKVDPKEDPDNKSNKSKKLR